MDANPRAEMEQLEDQLSSLDSKYKKISKANNTFKKTPAKPKRFDQYKGLTDQFYDLAFDQLKNLKLISKWILMNFQII